MSTRLELALQKYPDHDGSVRLLASRDPSGNLKYLDWGAKMVASGQALATEVADIIDLFHQFNGQWFGRRRERIRPDIYSYRHQDLATLRDNLRKIKRAQDAKRRKRERLYRIEGSVEAETVHDSPDLIVRHIRNKQASAHYGLGTKWCVSMLRANYFEEYETQNATFFFFERKSPKGDEYDKVALMVPRGDENGRRVGSVQAFTSTDKQVDMMQLARVHGPDVFDVFRKVHECSERYPGSAMFQVGRGTANEEQLRAVFADVTKGALPAHEIESVLESICCNDATPWPLLEEILERAPEIVAASWKRTLKRRWVRRRQGPGSTRELMRTLSAAIAIHPQTPTDVSKKILKNLRKRHISATSIRLTIRYDGRVGVAYGPTGVRFGRKRRRRQPTVKQLLKRAGMQERAAVRTRKRAERLEQKQKEAAEKKALAEAK